MVHELKFTSTDLYLKSGLFVVANILFPQVFHLIPGGGIMFLPIYFFTLISAMRFGWQTGVLTAVMTPIIGNMFFGAPMAAMVPDMLLKGAVLSVVAWFAVKRLGADWKSSFISVLAAWALVGIVELPFMGASVAFQDFVTGLPGMALMIVGSWAVNWWLDRK